MDGEQVKVCVGTIGPVREAHRRGRLERERRMGVDQVGENNAQLYRIR